MEIKIETTQAAELAVEALLSQSWFPNPGRTTRAYTEGGTILILTEHWEQYRVYPDGMIDRIYEARDTTERIILD